MKHFLAKFGILVSMPLLLFTAWGLGLYYDPMPIVGRGSSSLVLPMKLSLAGGGVMVIILLWIIFQKKRLISQREEIICTLVAVAFSSIILWLRPLLGLLNIYNP